MGGPSRSGPDWGWGLQGILLLSPDPVCRLQGQLRTLGCSVSGRVVFSVCCCLVDARRPAGLALGRLGYSQQRPQWEPPRGVGEQQPGRVLSPAPKAQRGLEGRLTWVTSMGPAQQVWC